MTARLVRTDDDDDDDNVDDDDDNDDDVVRRADKWNNIHHLFLPIYVTRLCVNVCTYIPAIMICVLCDRISYGKRQCGGGADNQNEKN